MMPDMTGFDVLQQLKKDPNLATIPVIFLTALSSKEDKLRAFNMGAEDYLTKPFQADEFTAHITAALRSTGKLTAREEVKTREKGHVIALYSPKGDDVTFFPGFYFLSGLALPLGGLAPLLKLYTTRHVVSLLETAVEELTLDMILRFAQNHRSNLKVIPAPGHYLGNHNLPGPQKLTRVSDLLADAGYQVLLDLGTALTPLSLAALQRADKTFVLTSGQPEANLRLETFLSSANQMGLDDRHVLPVINASYGESEIAKLTRVPAARIPFTSASGRTRLWLKEQALQKLVSIALA